MRSGRFEAPIRKRLAPPARPARAAPVIVPAASAPRPPVQPRCPTGGSGARLRPKSYPGAASLPGRGRGRGREPSISARSCETTRSITPPESAPRPRLGASASSSSKKTTHGAASRARRNTCCAGGVTRASARREPLRHPCCLSERSLSEDRAHRARGARLADVALTLADVHGDELWAFDGEEGERALRRHRLGQERLTGAGRAEEQHLCACTRVRPRGRGAQRGGRGPHARALLEAGVKQLRMLERQLNLPPRPRPVRSADPARGTRRVRLVRGEGRGVST